MNNNLKLDLGWCQGYMALQYHMEEALIENNLNMDKIPLIQTQFRVLFRYPHRQFQLNTYFRRRLAVHLRPEKVGKAVSWPDILCLT